LDVRFDAADLSSTLDAMQLPQFDSLSFGLIVMDRAGLVAWYNKFESTRAGIAGVKVVGRDFFASVGTCMNNHLVAERFRLEPLLDDFLDYVFTLRMVVTPVRLRLMARPESDRHYLAVTNRP
jgi:photoactive yellow protein